MNDAKILLSGIISNCFKAWFFPFNLFGETFEEEIQKVVDFVCEQQKAQYDSTLTMDDEERGATTMVDSKDDYEEPLYNEIVDFVVSQGKASASLLQRRFRLGYNRAARCIDLLEERGIVGPQNGSKPREVLVKNETEEE